MDVHSEYTKRQAGTDFNNHTDNSVNATNGTSPVMQHFESLSNPPPLPIIDITRSFIQHLAQVPVHSYLDQIQTLLPGLPKSNLNISSPIPRSRRRSSLDSEPMLYDSAHPKRVFGRQNDGECGPGNPCSDGSCCNNNGGCGYGPENCGAGNCTSNCEPLSSNYICHYRNNLQVTQRQNAAATALVAMSLVHWMFAVVTMATAE